MVVVIGWKSEAAEAKEEIGTRKSWQMVEMGSADFGSEDHQEDLGEKAPKAARRPEALTKTMLDEHFPCHAHYRRWCPDCAAGRSLSRQHKSINPSEEALGIVISMGYAF